MNRLSNTNRHFWQTCVRMVLLAVIVIQCSAPVSSVAAQGGIPSALQKYTLPGETAVEMVPVVYEGKTYRLFYFITAGGSSNFNKGEIFFESGEGKWNSIGVQAVLVMDDRLQPVTNEDMLRSILIEEMAGYIRNSLDRIPDYAPADEQILKDMANLTGGFWSNVAFGDKKIASLLKGDTEQSLDVEALRQILASPYENTGRITDYSNDVINLVNQGSEIKDAVEAVANMEKYANDDTIRATAKQAVEAFKDWKVASSPSDLRVGKIGDEPMFFANWLNLGELVLHFLFLEQLSTERALRLKQVSDAARTGKINISTDLLSAINQVVLEAENPSVQRLAVILDFARERAGELASEVSKEIITDWLTKQVWKHFGTQVTGHLWAGAIASVAVGFTLADVLYGRDDVYANLVTAEHAARIAQELLGNLNTMHQAGNPTSYNEKDDLYLQLAIVYNQAVSQYYRSYATTISSGRALTGLVDLLKGNEWTKAQQQFTQWAEQGDKDTYQYLIHPDIIDYAILTALARASVGIEPTTETVFVMDISGSMGDADPTGGRKIDAAKRAMGTLIRMIRAENRALGPVNMFSLVAFSDAASPLVEMGVDTKLVEAAVAQMEPQSGTNLFDGLTMANTQLAAHSKAEKKIVVLLSDGEPTVSPTYPQIYGPPFVSGKSEIYRMQEEVLQGPVATALASGHCIYTIGFGDPNVFYDSSDGPIPQIDIDFLTRVATETKCGEYLTASDASQLVKVYIKFHHASLGVLQAEQEGIVQPQQTTPPLPFSIPMGQNILVGSVSYPGSKVNLILTDPAGTIVDENYPDAKISEDLGFALITVTQPKSGKWSMSVYGEDVPDNGEPYYAAVSTRKTISHTNTSSGGLGIAIIILLVAGGAVGAASLLSRRRMVPLGGKGRKTKTNKLPDVAVLIGLNGTVAGMSFPVKDGMLIGRSSNCQLQIRDRAVSRQHARIRYSGGHWYIQDANSQSGIEVNGARLQAVALKNGDRIRIGSTEFEFRVG